MLDAASKFAASVNYVHPPYWLTISGKSGIGKTHIAKAIHRQFMEQNRFEPSRAEPIRGAQWFSDRENNRILGNTDWFCDWRKFADDIRSGGYERLIEDACKEWFVIIDDFGAERDPSGFVASAADRILNGRRDKWTLITTNLSLKDIGERMDVRIASRLIRDRNEFVEVEATDYALKK